jgi:hypothetical protein
MADHSLEHRIVVDGRRRMVFDGLLAIASTPTTGNRSTSQGPGRDDQGMERSACDEMEWLRLPG